MGRRIVVPLVALTFLGTSSDAFVPTSSLSAGSRPAAVPNPELRTSISTTPLTSQSEEEDDKKNLHAGAIVHFPDDDDDDNHPEEHADFPGDCMINGSYKVICDDELIKLPRHSTNEAVNDILEKTERALQGLHVHSIKLQDRLEIDQINKEEESSVLVREEEETSGDDSGHDLVFSNSYVDLGKIDTVGFDYDYTLVTYKQELLGLIYDMALKRLVQDKYYPTELLDAGLKFDPKFSIRGLAVDKETGWICHLSYTHKVAVAWEGRNKVSGARLMEEYSGKRALRPAERKKRLKPLNDLFSMAECCLIADVVQFFKDKGIPFCPRNAVVDILGAIGSTHISGDFHRLVAEDPGKYFEEQPHLREVLDKLKASGKRLIFASNSPFWYVDAGMRYVIGPNWREAWDVVIVSAGKPAFYTEDARPFREVSSTTGRIKFKKVDCLEKGEVYTEGCLRELIRCLDWSLFSEEESSATSANLGGAGLATAKVLYVGDSLFADLVDAKREFGWTTAAVTPEVGHEIEMQSRTQFLLSQNTIDLLLSSLRSVQHELGNGLRDEDDTHVLDAIERLVSKWRDQQTLMLGNPFGSVFRARYQPSLFAHSLRRYCDLYMSSVSSLRHYSPQHRFYPSDARLLSHEIRGSNAECWGLEDVLNYGDTEGQWF